MKWLRQLFCQHYKLHFVRNIYGDEIIEWGWKRSIWKCAKCGKILAHEHLAHFDQEGS